MTRPQGSPYNNIPCVQCARRTPWWHEPWPGRLQGWHSLLPSLLTSWWSPHLQGGVQLWDVTFFYALRWNKLIFHCSYVFFTTVKNITVMSLHDADIVLKLGTNDVNIMTSWRYCFPRYNVFGCFSLKKPRKFVEYLV